MTERRTSTRRRLLPRDGGRRADDPRPREKVFLPIGYCARAIGVTAETVRAWIVAGKIPFIELPNGYYQLSGATLDKILEERRNPTKPPETAK